MSYFQKIIFYEWFLRKRNIAGSVPCGGFRAGSRFGVGSEAKGMLPGKQSVESLLLSKQCCLTVMSLCINRI
jgi:hypothetical protein